MNANLFDPQVPPPPGEAQFWRQLPGSAPALAIREAAGAWGRLVLVIAENEQHAYRLHDELRFYAGGKLPVLHFPDWETLPFDVFSPHQDIISERLSTLYRLPTTAEGIVIIAADTLLQRLPPRDFLEARALLLRPGDRLDPLAMRDRLGAAGYQAVSEVQSHGEYAVRGALLDIFPMGSREAFRIDLFDDEVESIRRFDPETQRSIDKIDEVHLLPAREFPLDTDAIDAFRARYRARFSGSVTRSLIYQDVSHANAPGGIEYYLPLFFEQTVNLMAYLPAETVVIRCGDIDASLDAAWQQIEERHAQHSGDLERPLLDPAEAFHGVTDIKTSIDRQPTIRIDDVSDAPESRQLAFGIADTDNPTLTEHEDRGLAAVRQFLEDYPGRILLLAESAGRREALLDTLRPLGLTPRQYEGWSEFLGDRKRLGITVAPLEHGMRISDPALMVLAEPQLFGSRPPVRRRRKPVRDPEAVLRDLTDLNIGSPVVHQEHGVGRYMGLQRLSVGTIDQEFLTLEYAQGDKLYVPVSSLHLVHRYTGAEVEAAPLHRLGNDRWNKARARAAKRARDVAAELLDIQARRAARPGKSMTIEQADYRHFSDAFPFTETVDQAIAIQQVIDDLAAPTPMDRVVCGDVGFGKTEVAMRAAFAAVNNNLQVCILVPTTLLAQQHYQNFVDRFADWPIHIGVLSRLRTHKEQQRTLAGLADGSIDIVIGSHRLLQKDVHFRRLGLVIVDEEHRFGVRHKERLKALRAEVDLLTLTATPIPRTLNMSLAGLRDLSIIATPPTRRLAVQTFVAEWERGLVRDACLREIRRGGQVYFLHNQVEDIERFAARVRELVPEASLRVAHGQMRERELEQVMVDFYHRRFNVLVCTTIIESGIDVPSANTIIIDRADRFGLAQLHQLRGRVGRSHHRAYAYLVVPDRKALTADAEKRLDAIQSLRELGAGFALATHDLEIRGAGELLGEGQSGQMQEVGFSLYSQLLERAVKAIRAGKLPDENLDLAHDTEIDIGVATLFPEDYIPDVQMRLMLYKRVSSAADATALRELQVEMIDRFGLLPEAARNLFRITELKLAASPLGVEKIDAGPTGARLRFSSHPNVDPARLIDLIQQQPRVYRLEGQDKFIVERDLSDSQTRFEILQQVLNALSSKGSMASTVEACG